MDTIPVGQVQKPARLKSLGPKQKNTQRNKTNKTSPQPTASLRPHSVACCPSERLFLTHSLFCFTHQIHCISMLGQG